MIFVLSPSHRSHLTNICRSFSIYLSHSLSLSIYLSFHLFHQDQTPRQVQPLRDATNTKDAFEATPNANDDVVEQLEDDMNGANNVDESAALVDAIVAIALQRLSISTAFTADALAIETAATNLPGIDPPLLLAPHFLDPTLLVNNNNNPPLDDYVYDHNNDANDNDFNGANDDELLAVDPLANGVDAVDAPGVGEEAPPIEPSVVGAEGREVNAANLSQALVESRARDDSGNVVSKIMFSILQTARI